MTATIMPAAVRKSVTVDAPVKRAFEVFTQRFGSWWPASCSIGKSTLTTAVIEPKAGGRWYEIGEDGTECEWGQVLEWQPPSRLLLAWRIRGDWQYDPALLTEVEIKFIPLGENSTRVEPEHRRLENMGEAAEAIRQTFEQGWGGILEGYAAEAGRDAA